MIKIKFPSSKFKYMLKILNYGEEPKTLKSGPGRKLPALEGTLFTWGLSKFM